MYIIYTQQKVHIQNKKKHLSIKNKKKENQKKWTKDFGRHFIKKYIEIAGKYKNNITPLLNSK